jgi:hypothetical protein
MLSLLSLPILPGRPPAAATEPPPGSLDLNRPADLVTAVMKMRCSTDGLLRFGWLRAKRFSYIDGEVLPLLDLLAGTVSRAVKTAEGVYDLTVLETTYYLDSNSGELLGGLAMPGTGQVIQVPLYRSGPKTIVIESSNVTAEESTGSAGVVADDSEKRQAQFAPKGSVRLERSVGPAVIDGETVWIRTEEYGRVRPASAAQSPVFYRESATWQGRLTELQDPQVHSAWTALSYSAATSWRPWMQMGDVKGHTMSNGIGGKVDDINEMPADWLQLTEKHHPDILDDPGRALGVAT